MYKRESKKIKISEYWGIECVTIIQDNIKSYEVHVYMANVPWEEKVESHKGILTSEEANFKYKEMVVKYKER